MITVEYYWDCPHVKGLLATYKMIGDGTPGTAELEPFPSQVESGPVMRENYKRVHDYLSKHPGAFMEVDLEEHQLGKEWTLELVQEQANYRLKTFRAIIIEPGTPKGTSNPVEPHVFGKVRVVPQSEIKKRKPRNDWERRPNEAEGAFQHRIAVKKRRIARLKAGAERRAGVPPKGSFPTKPR